MAEAAQAPARTLEWTEILTMLLEGSERVSSTLDLDELMLRIAEVVKQAIDYDVFAILLLNEKTSELRVRFSVGHPDGVVKRLQIKLGQGIVGRAAQTRRSVRVGDVREDPSYIQSLPAMRSELAVPLVAKNRVIGVIDLEAAWPDFFTGQHQNLLELLAGRIAVAIENAGLYRRAQRQARTLHLLNEISRELSSVLVLNELLRKIGTLTKRLVDYHRFGILLADDRTRTFNSVLSIKQDERMPETSTVAFGQGIAGAAANERRTIVVPDVAKDARYIMVNPETRAEMVVPLVFRDRVIGVVDLESPRPNYFTEEHIRIFSTLAPQIAVAIENARLYERVVRSEARLEQDLERAQEIQVHLMPGPSPAIPGMEVHARFLPARELGGDLYDFLNYGRDRHLLVIGDVSGKGAPAALYGAMVSGILRSLAPLRLPAPDLLRKLNVTLLERKIEGHFITLTCGIWEPRSRTLHLANAGMPLPILIRHGRGHMIRAEGVPLGLLEHIDYQGTTLTLEKSDLLALFSDGLTEANDRKSEEFGPRRLESVIREGRDRSVAEIIDKVFAEVARFEQGRPRADDQTMVLMKVR